MRRAAFAKNKALNLVVVDADMMNELLPQHVSEDSHPASGPGVACKTLTAQKSALSEPLIIVIWDLDRAWT